MMLLSIYMYEPHVYKLFLNVIYNDIYVKIVSIIFSS
jgi:hypothetical protein